jgi:hypothetical protein
MWRASLSSFYQSREVLLISAILATCDIGVILVSCGQTGLLLRLLAGNFTSWIQADLLCVRVRTWYRGNKPVTYQNSIHQNNNVYNPSSLQDRVRHVRLGKFRKERDCVIMFGFPIGVLILEVCCKYNLVTLVRGTCTITQQAEQPTTSIHAHRRDHEKPRCGSIAVSSFIIYNFKTSDDVTGRNM